MSSYNHHESSSRHGDIGYDKQYDIFPRCFLLNKSICVNITHKAMATKNIFHFSITTIVITSIKRIRFATILDLDICRKSSLCTQDVLHTIQNQVQEFLYLDQILIPSHCICFTLFCVIFQNFLHRAFDVCQTYGDRFSHLFPHSFVVVVKRRSWCNYMFVIHNITPMMIRISFSSVIWCDFFFKEKATISRYNAKLVINAKHIL